MNFNAAPEPNDVLNGWKEIAAHLGRSARSVQRWEHDLGLPIHRIATPDGGSIVYALRSEVDAWRRRHDESLDLTDLGVRLAPETASHPTHLAERGKSADGRVKRWLKTPVPAWAAVLLAGVSVAAASAVWMVPRTGVPASWEFEGREVVAYSSNSRRLWSHPFGRIVSSPSTLFRGPGILDDVTGDGRPEALTPVRYAAPQMHATESDAVFAFGADGSIVWSVQPDLTMTSAEETFYGPWYVYDVATGMTAGGPRTWIAYSHHIWWPAFVLEVAPNGAATVRYVQPGRIYSLTYWATRQGPLLMAGGALNEAGRASVALMNLDHPPARWKGPAGPALECPNCPRADPSAMLLLPNSDVTTALARPSGWVMRARLKESSVELSVNDGFGTGSLVRMNDDLQVTTAARSDRYWQVHRAMEEEGRISHRPEECPDHARPLEIRQWTPTRGWSTTLVPLRALPIPPGLNP